MTKPQDPQFLKKERQKTDGSLVAERNKTNDSLTETKEHTELRTDRTVEEERRKADKIANKERRAADSESAGIEVPDHKISSVEKGATDDRVLDERRRADDAIVLERLKVDQAIDKEREAKKALAGRMLEQERKMTDKNLSSERAQTDSEVRRTSDRLGSEISEHQKTRAALTTREEFLAIVSHDLKNPIGAASMCAEILLDDDSFKNIGPEAIRSVELIKRNVDMSLRLISDLLDMERIEAGKLQLILKKQDLVELIRECMESFTHQAKEKNVALSLSPLNETYKINFDQDRILQVLSNLIGNALKFTPVGGSITLATFFSETEARVSVSDSGPGIPEDKKDRIFRRFAQLGQDDRQGLGLGLYISKMLIEEHEGRLWFESRPSEGCTFTFALPR